MDTLVTQNYGNDFNVSITEREGKVTLVTTWVTGDPKSTRRVGYNA